jgi:hypothetical protein
MPTWDQLLAEFQAQPDDQAKGVWIDARLTTSLQRVAAERGGRHVILYGSAFLQKPLVPGPFTQVTHEDINGLMTAVYQMDVARGLTLILHTPGGVTSATETIVQYLRSKFADIEVAIPTYAMSAGTMIALASNRILMGRQSQLGPIDALLPHVGRLISAQAVKDQFELAKTEIKGDLTLAHLWAPILSSLGPSLLNEATNALSYGETMVARWLATYMFAGAPDAAARGEAVAKYFNDAGQHKNHGRRIDRDEARTLGVIVEDIEPSADLQDAVLTAYHMMTIAFEQSAPLAKMIVTDAGRRWLRNMPMQMPMLAPGPP